jgi:hypothetical protein
VKSWVDRRVFAPAPAERIAAVRVLVGAFGTVYVLARVPYILDIAALPDARFEAVGVVNALDGPLPVWTVRVLLVGTALLGVAFTVGWRYRVVAPVYAAALLATMSYSNSWQHVAHTENLLVLHTAVLAIAPAAAAWSLDRHRARTSASVPPSADYGWPLRLMSVLTVTTYVLAGVAKMRHGGTDWISGDVLRNLIAHDNLRKIVLGDIHSPIGGWLVAHAWLFPPLAFASCLVELGAPLALLGGRVRHVWVAAAWLFHVAVLALMAITFFYPLSGIAYASMLRPEVAAVRIGHRLRRRAPTERALAAYGRPDAG